jgi:hypothetical protein
MISSVYAGFPEHVASLGSYRLNVTVLPASVVAPDRVNISLGRKFCTALVDIENE